MEKKKIQRNWQHRVPKAQDEDKQNKCRTPLFSSKQSNVKFIERGKFDTPNTQLNNSSLSWLDPDTSIKSAWVKKS